MKKILSLLALALVSTQSFASTLTIKQIDEIMNSTGGSTLAVPSVGTAFLSDTSTNTVTNKSMSGASNTFTAIPAGTALSGQVPVANGGTGAASFTLNGILFGNTTSPLSVTAAGTQFQTLVAGAGGVPSFGSLNLASSVAVGSSILPVANGGTGLAALTAHYTLIGAGTSNVSLVSPSTAGFVLTSNGPASDPSYQAAPASAAPSINNSVASPQSVSAAGGISLSSISYRNVVYISGASAGSNVVTATPSITACTAAGQELNVVSESSTNFVTLQNNGDLAGSSLELNGPWTSGMNNGAPYVVNFECDTALKWVELSRNN